MNDRELLELAAKAIGLEYDGDSRGEPTWFNTKTGRMYGTWNPLDDDGDALRLSVKLKLDICRPNGMHDGVCVWVDHIGDFIEVPNGKDAYAATRRAIVRAAAEIGKAMP